MRVALGLGVALSFITGCQLFVLTDHTASLFAWTIDSGLSATIIGAFYWEAALIALLCVRRQPWARARVAVPGVAVFLWATLLATLLHLAKFHLTAGDVPARVAAWIWLTVYIADPILLTTALVMQWRAPGEDPPRTALLPRSYRSTLLAFGFVIGVVGASMIALPDLAIRIAVWPLTPLTSRAIGVWVLASSVVLVTMWWENDADRIRPAAAGMATLAPLLCVGFIRYFAEFTSAAVGAISIATTAIVAAIGLIGMQVRSSSSSAR